jgi:prolyl oligopeptidase
MNRSTFVALTLGVGIALIVQSTLFADPAKPMTPPPISEVKPVTDRFFETSVTDSYRWLEDDSDPQVQQWNVRQNEHTRSYLDALAVRAPLKEKLSVLIKAASPNYFSLAAAGTRLFAEYNDPKFQQPSLVVLDANADIATQRTVLDPNKLDAKGLTAIDWFVPSHDGKRVAVSLSKNGSEDGTLHIYDVATGKESGDVIPRVQYPTAGGSVAWAGDGKGFWYTRYPGDEAKVEDRHFFLQTYFHKLGTDWKKDPPVLGTADGLPRIAEIFLDNSYAPDLVLASVQKGDGGEWQHWILRSDGTKSKISDFNDKIVAATIGPDHSLYMVSRDGAPNGKVLKLSPAATLAQAKVIIPEFEAAIQISDFQHTLTLSSNRLFVNYIVGGPGEIRCFDLDGKAQSKLPFSDLASFGGLTALPNGDVMIGVASYLKPFRFMRFIAATQKVDETKLAQTSPAKFDDVEIVRIFATSKDGTKVPVNVARKRGITLNGKNPALLYGYGGYGVSQEPHFLGPSIRLWLDAGGVYAEANTRGGAEYGERWHAEGMLTKKQNVFDDFAAAAQALIDQKYTDSEHLALRGGSNGGLLMGALITQHPELMRAVVSSVGIYDMLRVELDPNGQFNITEFGTVKDKQQFAAMYAYSPYHHVAKGKKYPAILMPTGANDGRVNPMQSRKFAAALQASGSGRPIYLRISTTSGHGIGSSLNDRIEEGADWLSFLFDQLGMKLPAS